MRLLNALHWKQEAQAARRCKASELPGPHTRYDLMHQTQLV